MLTYTGHPLVDVGVATITAFSGKDDPSLLDTEDLHRVADYMQKNYVIDPLKSFLTVAFPNSGFTQPAYEKQPKKREIYAQRVLRSFDQATPTLPELCVFTGEPVVAVSLDVAGGLQPGRAFRQHVPLLAGEGRINFYPYGDAGLPVSGKALLAIQAMPLGCRKVAGRLLAVHSDRPDVTYQFARTFLEHNRKAIQTAQLAGEKKLPESPHRVTTLLIHTLLEIQQQQKERSESEDPVSITAYHLSNSGKGVMLDIYHLPLEVYDFLVAARTPRYRQSWGALCDRGWELVQAKRPKKSAQSASEQEDQPRRNMLFDDLFRLPEEACLFIRRYFLRAPLKKSRLPGDPRTTYSIREEAHLVSWELAELFLRKVVYMNASRIQHLRDLGDALARYVGSENDKKFFHRFLTSPRYDALRANLIRVSVARMKGGEEPLIGFDAFIEAFEQTEDLPYSDWRLARDLVLIRMIEQLHQSGWLKQNLDELPEPVTLEENIA